MVPLLNRGSLSNSVKPQRPNSAHTFIPTPYIISGFEVLMYKITSLKADSFSSNQVPLEELFSRHRGQKTPNQNPALGTFLGTVRICCASICLLNNFLLSITAVYRPRGSIASRLKSH